MSYNCINLHKTVRLTRSHIELQRNCCSTTLRDQGSALRKWQDCLAHRYQYNLSTFLFLSLHKISDPQCVFLEGRRWGLSLEVRFSGERCRFGRHRLKCGVVYTVVTDRQVVAYLALIRLVRRKCFNFQTSRYRSTCNLYVVEVDCGSMSRRRPGLYQFNAAAYYKLVYNAYHIHPKSQSMTSDTDTLRLPDGKCQI